MHGRNEPLALIASMALAAVASPAAGGPILDHETKIHSNGNEELVVRDYFKDARDGFFLDVGCAFPRNYSNTFYLEKRLGWSGIGIDAIEKYAAGWKRLRPRSKFFTYLVTDHSGTKDTFFQSGYHPVSSIHRDLVDHHDYEEIKVESITLDDLLEREGVEKIDFLSLDIEGAGLLALRGFDIQKYKPELVCMEPVEDKMGLLAYFKENGYRWRRDFMKYDFGNWYFEPKDRPLFDQRSLPSWTRAGDNRITFEMEGRELVARIPADVAAGAEALLCSPDGFSGFVLESEVQPSAAGLTAKLVVQEFSPDDSEAVRVETRALTPDEWSHLQVRLAASDARAMLNSQPIATTEEKNATLASVCLGVGTNETGTARELRWRRFRIGPHEGA